MIIDRVGDGEGEGEEECQGRNTRMRGREREEEKVGEIGTTEGPAARGEKREGRVKGLVSKGT